MSDSIRQLGQSMLLGELVNTSTAKDAEIHALKMAQIYSGGVSTSELKRKISELESERLILIEKSDMSDMAYDAIVKEVRKIQAENAELKNYISEREQLLTEWMHNNEACKRLARKFGKQLGLTPEEVTKEFSAQALDIADEDPSFANTELTQRKRAAIQG